MISRLIFEKIEFEALDVAYVGKATFRIPLHRRLIISGRRARLGAARTPADVPGFCRERRERRSLRECRAASFPVSLSRRGADRLISGARSRKNSAKEARNARGEPYTGRRAGRWLRETVQNARVTRLNACTRGGKRSSREEFASLRNDRARNLRSPNAAKGERLTRPTGKGDASASFLLPEPRSAAARCCGIWAACE